MAPARIRFWGTRGSIAKPGAKTVRYGGNTSCVQVTSPGGSLLIIDCGTGAHDLGQSLVANSKGPLRGSILFSHTHWDHIQGFPFFAPLFLPGGHWDIYGPSGLGHSLRDALAGQMEHTYFPVTLDEVGASIQFHDLYEGDFEIDDIRINACYLNHPALTLGYRMQMGGASVVYSCDHEPHARAPGQNGPVHELDRRHSEFLAGADLVIHDSQFTDKEYFASHRGWGHSPVEYVTEMGLLGGAKRMAFTHHDPRRTDDDLDQIVASVRAGLREKKSTMEVFAAAEGQVIELDTSGGAKREFPRSLSATKRAEAPARKNTSVTIGISDTRLALLLADAVRSAGAHLTHALDAASATQMAKSDPPSLLILEDEPAGLDGLRICRELRADGDPRLMNLPIFVVAGRERAGEGHVAGVTGWLVTPFSTQYARTQIQAILLRSNVRWVRPTVPEDEEERLAALRGLSILDTQPEERFDRITRLAASVGELPIALISLVDANRQWFKSCQGISASETSREVSLCAHAVANRKPLIIPDTLLDDRCADNPLVVGKPRIRFYAGFPVFHTNGRCLGTMCLMDTRPRNFSREMIRQFEKLAAQVQQELNAGVPPAEV